jgi:hypothetical protein
VPRTYADWMTSPENIDRFEANRAHRDERVPIHVASRYYDVDGFRAGRDTLQPFERDEVGAVAGKSLVHLQCYFGMDTLSWARSDANVTGLDFSQPAIEQARALAAELVRLGGMLYLADGHSLSHILADDTLTVVNSYFGAEPHVWDEPGTYADLQAATVQNISYEWAHPLG